MCSSGVLADGSLGLTHISPGSGRVINLRKRSIIGSWFIAKGCQRVLAFVVHIVEARRSRWLTGQVCKRRLTHSGYRQAWPCSGCKVGTEEDKFIFSNKNLDSRREACYLTGPGEGSRNP
jgi:hypothetical protein